LTTTKSSDILCKDPSSRTDDGGPPKEASTGFICCWSESCRPGKMATPRDICTDINTLSTFLAHPRLPDLSACQPVDCIILCASAVLSQAAVVFRALEQNPSLAKTLVLVGGIGHSTTYIYEAVARHPRFHALAEKVRGLAEARVLELILRTYFDVERITSEGCCVLIEDQSTNCGANAIQTRKVLEGAGVPTPRSCVVVQDPTMSRRTIASFQKLYDDLPAESHPSFISCPVFVPTMRKDGEALVYDIQGPHAPQHAELWDHERLFSLLVGEIPRLRDDENGYGPQGSDFIVHVDVPAEVEIAAKRVQEVLGASR